MKHYECNTHKLKNLSRFCIYFFILVKINLKLVIIGKRTEKFGFNFVLKVSFHRGNKFRRKYSTYIYYIYIYGGIKGKKWTFSAHWNKKIREVGGLIMYFAFEHARVSKNKDWNFESYFIRYFKRTCNIFFFKLVAIFYDIYHIYL